MDFAGWNFETSGTEERIEIKNGVATLTAGGYLAETHYARLRYRCDFPFERKFSIETVLELPDDFYAKQNDYVKLMGTDNFPVRLEAPWRINLVLFSDHYPHLRVQHQGIEEWDLWKGAELLPVGIHTYKLVIRASLTRPLTELYIDGQRMVSSTERNVPDLLPGEQVVSWAMGGIDGAAGYDESSLSIKLHRMDVRRTMSLVWVVSNLG